MLKNVTVALSEKKNIDIGEIKTKFIFIFEPQCISAGALG